MNVRVYSDYSISPFYFGSYLFTVTYVLFVSWTLVASHSTIGWDITATSFQPFLQAYCRKCMPLYHFCRRQQMTGLNLETISFFNRAWDHTGEKWALSNSSFQHDCVKNIQCFSLSPTYLLHCIYTTKQMSI